MTVEELKEQTRRIALNHMIFDEPLHDYDKTLDLLIQAQDEKTRKEIAETEAKIGNNATASRMMEIPAGRFCDSTGEVSLTEKWLCPPTECGFLKSDDCGNLGCALFRTDIDPRDPFVGYRCLQCLSAYPNGATITVTPNKA